jgi:hypothetical protein
MYLADEIFAQSLQARKSGKKTCRFSPVMFRFCIELYMKMGNGRYDFLSQVISIPSASTMSRICSSGSAQEDGILYENLEWIGKELESMVGENTPMTNIQRLFWISFDSTKIAEGIVYNSRTNAIIGTAYDWRSSFDAFKAVVDNMHTAVTVEDDALSSEKTADAAIDALKERAGFEKHYMIFIAQRACDSGKRLKTTVARYGLETVDAQFLKHEIRQIISAM